LDRRAFLGGLAAAAASCRSRASAPGATGDAGSRIVSLSPGITDALFAIGAGASVVARSDYCDYPAEAQRLPRVGTSITPNYEAIARLEPTLIVSEDNAAARRRELEALARTLLIRWLSLDEVVRGIRELGRVTGAQANADVLAERLARRLGVAAPAVAPKILLVIGSDTGRLDDIWFIRKNSLQGAALHAAGGRNAVDEDVAGQPRLSLERLVALDPDAVIVLSAKPSSNDAELAPYRKLTALRAVRDDRLAVVAAPEAYVNGPRVLAFVERLAPVVARMRAR
jgi:ABC-type Fe3+-hydroxamate transport system substrate-binding protein